MVTISPSLEDVLKLVVPECFYRGHTLIDQFSVWIPARNTRERQIRLVLRQPPWRGTKGVGRIHLTRIETFLFLLSGHDVSVDFNIFPSFPISLPARMHSRFKWQVVRQARLHKVYFISCLRAGRLGMEGNSRRYGQLPVSTLFPQ
jgi:hypothetical protein